MDSITNISYNIAMIISNFINKICEGNKVDRCEALNIVNKINREKIKLKTVLDKDELEKDVNVYSLFCDSITRDILFISLKSERDEINEFYYSHFCFPLLYECGLFFEYFENKEKYLNNMGLVFIHNIRNDKTVFIWHETNNDNIKVKEVEKGVPMTSFALIPIRFKKNSIVTIIDEESFFNGINNDFKMENNINCITEYEMVYDDEMVLQKVDYFKE